MADKSVVVRLKAIVSDYKAGMAEAARATDGVTKKSGDFTKLGAQATKVGGTLTRSVTLPLLAVGAAAGKLSYDFEATFARMEGLAGVAAGEVDGLKESVLGLAGETGRGPQDLAEGLYFIESAGIKGKTALEALEVSAKGATSGLGSTAAVADAVTSAINAYGAANITAAEAGDVLAATAREGKAEASELAPQFGRLLPVAAELGVSFQEVGAGMAFLSRSSGDAALSATQLGGVLEKMLNPSEEGADALAAIGSSAAQLRKSVADDGLLATLTDLRERLEANGMTLADFSRDNQFLQGALQLTGVQAADAAAVFEALENSTGSLGRAFDAVASTDGFKVKQALAEVQVALIQIGDVILPLVAQIAAFGAGAVAVFTGLPGPVAGLAVAFGAVLIAVGPMLSVAGKLATNWGTLVKAFDRVAISAYNASGSVGKLAAGGSLVAIVVAGLTKAVNDHAHAMDQARQRGTEFADAFAGDFDPAKASMSELTAEIGRLSAESDKLSTHSTGLSVVDEQAKTTAAALDEDVVAMTDLVSTAAHLESTLGVTGDEALALAQDTDFMAASTDNATGDLDDEAAAAALVQKSFSDLADELNAMFDPLFGVQSAMNNLKDAQKAVADAVAANSDANADNNVTAEEMIRLNQAAVGAAVDYQGKLITLKAAVEDGSVSIQDSIATLQLWVAQGLITQAQADEAAFSIGVMGGKADEVNGKSVIVHVVLYGATEAITRLDEVARKAGQTYYSVASITARDHETNAGGSDIGGPVSRNRNRRPGPTDTVPMMLAPEEYVLSAATTARVGVAYLDALNAGASPVSAGPVGQRPQMAAPSGGGVTVINNNNVTSPSLDPRDLARTVRDAAEVGARRGIRRRAA